MTQAAIHANRPVLPDAAHEIALAAHFREAHAPGELTEILDRFSQSSGAFDAMMRRVLWRALLRKVGHGVRIGRGVRLLHPETLELGDNVFIGDDAVLQGHAKGSGFIGSRSWIGPQTYLDARALHMGEAVGFGPGARVLCSEHSGEPVEEPVIATALEIGPVHIEDGADIGMNAVVLPGVRIGKGSVVGAGSVVTRDVPPGAVAAGVPAKVLHMRGETTERSP